jgi:hypothetical protein
MKTSDKNKIFEFLNSSSYSINDFRIDDNSQVIYKPVVIEGEKPDIIPISTITYKDTQLKFEITNPFPSFDQYRYRYKVFGPNYLWTDYLPKNQVGYFEDIIADFKVWLIKEVEVYIKEIAEASRF